MHNTGPERWRKHCTDSHNVSTTKAHKKTSKVAMPRGVLIEAFDPSGQDRDVTLIDAGECTAQPPAPPV